MKGMDGVWNTDNSALSLLVIENKDLCVFDHHPSIFLKYCFMETNWLPAKRVSRSVELKMKYAGGFIMRLTRQFI